MQKKLLSGLRFRKAKAIITLVLIMSLTLVAIFSFNSFQSKRFLNSSANSQTLGVGDYVEFGGYYGEPIIWRVVAIENGNPLLFSERILSLKAFDSKGGPREELDSQRADFGTNFWYQSTLRKWLNSSDSSGNVFSSYPHNPPSEENVSDNPYDKEPGFLANFTKAEQDLIAPRRHKVILSDLDNVQGVRDGGSQRHDLEEDIENAINNYNVSNYHNVEDKVFLLSVKEIKEYIYDNGFAYTRQPTLRATEFSSFTDDTLNTNIPFNYLTRTPTPYYSFIVRQVSPDGLLNFRAANYGYQGVVPALSLKAQHPIAEGNGSINSPYKLLNNQERVFFDYYFSQETTQDSNEFTARSGLIEKAISENMPLRFETNSVNIEVPNNVLRNELAIKENEEIKLQVLEVEDDIQNIMIEKIENTFSDIENISNIKEFNMLRLRDNHLTTLIKSFSTPLKITLKDLGEFENPSRTAIYNVIPKYDFEGNITDVDLSYAGGEFDGKDIVFYTDHFSFFIPIERNATFADMSYSWARASVETLASRGIIRGYPDGNFKPNNHVSRVDFAVLLNNGIAKKPSEYKAIFRDVRSDQYFAGHVITLNKHEITDIHSSVDPNTPIDSLPEFNVYDENLQLKNITREQTATFIANGYKYLRTFKEHLPEITPKPLHYKDASDVSSQQMRDNISIAYQLGIMKGYPDNTFGPQNVLTRAEAAQSISLFLTKFNSNF